MIKISNKKDWKLILITCDLSRYFLIKRFLIKENNNNFTFCYFEDLESDSNILIEILSSKW